MVDRYATRRIWSAPRDLSTRHFGLQIEDINDERMLRAWLIEQDSYEVSVAIAARAALRVQPLLWARLAPANPDEEFTALPVFWSTIMPAVAAVSPTTDVSGAAALAADATSGIASRAAEAAALASRAAATRAAAAARAAEATHASVHAPAAAFWEEVRRDAHLLLKGDRLVWDLPLW